MQDYKWRLAATIQKSILKYFNIYSFALLPLYALIGFLVFGRKRNNYTEHLVINAYIQGLTFLSTILFFILTLFAFGEYYNFGIILTIIYYAYAYGRLYGLSFWKRVLFLLKFIGTSLVLLLISTLFLVLIGIISAMITG